MVFLRVLSVHHTSSLYIATMLAAAFLCRAFALAGILHSQSRFGLWNLIPHTIPTRKTKPRNTESRARRLPTRSQVYYPGESCDSVYTTSSVFLLFFFLASQEFDSGIPHWVNSSSQIPTCSVEPGTPSLPRAMLV